MNPTSPPTPCQDRAADLLISNIKSLRDYLAACPHAQTLHAYSLTLARSVFCPLPCKQWSCRPCAETKIRRLAAKTREAKPNRMLTLTVDPKLWEGRREAFDGTRREIPRLFNFLRKRFGEVEYLRCTELTAMGWPHYHFLIRSGFIPHTVVKHEWERLTGARIVDLRQVKSTFRSYQYLVKYLAKLHRITWTERHVSYSASFFAPEPEKKPSELQLQKIETMAEHPVNWLYREHRGRKIARINNAWFTILDPPNTHGDF